jgi:hypothetical protein
MSQRPTFRRLLFPILTVLGFLVCAYAAFFVGIKEDFPVPPGAEQRLLSGSQQKTILDEWNNLPNWQATTVNVYTVREKPGAAATFYTRTFHNLGWTDAPNPGQPKDFGTGQAFTVLNFVKNKQQVIITLSDGADLSANTSAFGKVLNSLYGGVDNLAILVNGVTR